MLFRKLITILKANLLHQESYAKKPPTETYSYKRNHNSFDGQQKQYRSTAPPPNINAKEAAYYDALEITPSASFTEIKAAYKKLVKKYHPDLFNNNQQKRQYAETVTQQLNEAYNYFESKAGNGK